MCGGAAQTVVPWQGTAHCGWAAEDIGPAVGQAVIQGGLLQGYD